MMLEHLDRDAGVVVWHHAPPFADADFEAHRQLIDRLGDDAPLSARLVAVLITEPTAPNPSAIHRKGIHAALQKFPATARAFVVSQNPMTMGAVTAIRWLGMLPFEIHVFASWESLESARSLDADTRSRCRRARELAGQASSAQSTRGG